MRTFIINIFMCLCLLQVSSCRKNNEILKTDFEIVESDNLQYTASDSVEAIEFSLWLSGQLEAPDSLVSEALNRLHMLREKYRATYPVSRRFMPPWNISELICDVDSITADSINKNTYTGWYQLPFSLQPDSILYFPDNFGNMLISIKEPYHPRRLAEIYATLPGINYCEPNGIILVADADFPFTPGIINGSLAFLFPNATYLASIYYYFRFIENEPQFIGQWNMPNDPEPDWWPEARVILDNFFEWDGGS